MIKHTGSWLCKIVHEAHIYSTCGETVIKMALILVSFVLSVVCYLDDTRTELADGQTYLAFGGSVMMYGLSLMIEVCMFLNQEEHFPKKLVVGCVFGSGIVALIRGLCHTFSLASWCVKNTIICCSIPVGIYILDAILIYLIKPPSGPEDNLSNVKVGGP